MKPVALGISLFAFALATIPASAQMKFPPTQRPTESDRARPINSGFGSHADKVARHNQHLGTALSKPNLNGLPPPKSFGGVLGTTSGPPSNQNTKRAFEMQQKLDQQRAVQTQNNARSSVTGVVSGVQSNSMKSSTGPASWSNLGHGRH